MISLVIPFYNEAECVAEVVSGLVTAVRSHGLPVKFILVNNGSYDQTGVILGQLQKKFREVRVVAINKNRGYGYGIRIGLAGCNTAYAGFMCGDGQTDPEDVVRVVETLQRDTQIDAAKVVRRIRHDSLKRRIVSRIYNTLFSCLFMFPVKDVNGTPKVFKREVYEKCQLTANDWFIDAEFMLKVRRYGFNLKEIPTHFYERKTGSSSVNLYTMIEFFKNLLFYRLKRFGELSKSEMRSTL